MNNYYTIFLLSGLLNFLFLLLVTWLIAKKGGISYLIKKIDALVNSKTSDFQVAEQTYYLHKTSLFQVLPKSDSEIIFLGDSITDECEWAELIGPNIKNRGISGDTTIGILNRLDELLKSKPKSIFLMVGINDFFHTNKSVEQIFEQYKQIVITVRDKSPNTKLFIQSVLPINNQYNIDLNPQVIIKFNQHLKELASQFSLPYIDLFSQLSDSQNQLDTRYTLDGVHLNGQAYSVWKQVIEKYIVE